MINYFRKHNPNLEIPFNKAGNMQREENYLTEKKIHNHVFPGSVQVIKVHRRDHAHYIKVLVREGQFENEFVYDGFMSISDFVKMSQNTVIQYGKASGLFAFNRIGSAFGIIYVGSE